MPRKGKQVKEDPPSVKDTPVVFFLRITDETESTIIPAGEVTSYSDILNSVEVSRISERFNTDLLKSILDKHITERYSPQTACFWCCHQFSWISSVLPISYDTYNEIYTCIGHFCSPECALSYTYNDPTLSDSTRWNRHSLLRHLYAKLYTERELSPSPPRTMLRLFGGPLDIEQFRDYITGQNDLVMSEFPPVRLQFPSMNVQGPLRDIKKYVSLSTDVIEKASEQLRLRRSKPVTSNIQTLDVCIRRKV